VSHEFWKQGVVAVLTACALAACGGGGGVAGESPPAPAFTVGGSINGLVGSVTLQNTGGAQLTVSANGSFAFAGTVVAGSSYSITVAAQPELQSCTVANGSGTAAANVTNIAINCTDATPPALSLALQAIKALRFSWTAVPGVTRYKLLEDATGGSGFTQAGADIEPSATSLDRIVPLYLRVNARYIVQACAASRCIDSNTMTVSGSLAPAVGYFKSSNIRPQDRFGMSVALSADGATLAVGAPLEDSNAESTGSVYVFARDGAGSAWRQQAQIKASNPERSDLFGFGVALDASGSTLAIGAPGAAGAVPASGVVYIFERSKGTNGDWTQQALVEASNAESGDAFGWALALSDGGRLAVGAPGEDGVGNLVLRSGAAYVFVREGAGQGFGWRQEAYLKATNAGDGDEFGLSVALSRDGATLAVAAPFEDSNDRGVSDPSSSNELATDSGAVYVFAPITQAALWAQQAYIKASNASAGDVFGAAVALSADGSTLAAGASHEDSAATGVGGNQGDDTARDAGAAYVFVRTRTRVDDVWTQQSYVKASDTIAPGAPGGDQFGISLALSADGSILAVGGPGEDSSAIGIGGDDGDISAEESGAAYVFERSGADWAQRAFVKPSNTRPGYVFGWPVALSGDGATLAAGASHEPGSAPGVNGDQDSPPIEDAGAVYLY
jgi:trimeric autotransporter adhesin